MLTLLLLSCGTPGLDDLTTGSSGDAHLEVHPAEEVRFDRAPEGVLVSAEVVVTNVGGVYGLVEDAWVDGYYADYFDVELPSEMPGRVDPGQEMVLTLHFEAPAIGRFSADLFLSAPDTPSGGISRPLVGRGCEDADRNDRCD